MSFIYTCSSTNGTTVYILGITNADSIDSSSGSAVQKAYLRQDTMLQYLSSGDNKPADGFSGQYLLR